MTNKERLEHPDGENPYRLRLVESGATGALPPGEEREQVEVEGQIERTRSEIATTIDALQERLSADRLRIEAKEAINDVASHAVETAKEAIRDVADYAKETLRGATVGTAEGAAARARGAASGFGVTLSRVVRRYPIPVTLAACALGFFVVRTAVRRRPIGLRTLLMKRRGFRLSS